MYGIAFEHWLFMFFTFCMIGWIHETMVESLYHKKFVNRGSLHGPYIPIYGFGGCMMIFCCNPFRQNGFFVFLSGLICCTLLEYFTGWLMETVFHRQFWDYSMMKLTYKNRISLLSSLCWGAMSLLQIYILFPFMQWLGNSVGSLFMTIFDITFAVAMGTDMAVTVSQTIGWHNVAKKMSPDQIMRAIRQKRMQVGNIFGHFSDAIQSRISRNYSQNKANGVKPAIKTNLQSPEEETEEEMRKDA
ncbi:MAG: putative ABC transporter permease [Firmicutes bacterium]|nr:putative ABC transporter permease [[Eubacterium] siraeum]MCM1487735.1 putative ABC transporter permease [Bacillota bacterium]